MVPTRSVVSASALVRRVGSRNRKRRRTFGRSSGMRETPILQISGCKCLNIAGILSSTRRIMGLAGVDIARHKRRSPHRRSAAHVSSERDSCAKQNQCSSRRRVSSFFFEGSNTLDEFLR